MGAQLTAFGGAGGSFRPSLARAVHEGSLSCDGVTVFLACGSLLPYSAVDRVRCRCRQVAEISTLRRSGVPHLGYSLEIKGG